MQDIRLIRDDPQAFDVAMKRRGVEAQSGVEIAGGNSPQDRKTILNSLPR